MAKRHGVQFEPRDADGLVGGGRPADTARLLGMRTGTPLLVFRRISSADGQPVEDMTSWYRGDHYEVTMQLHRDGQEPENPTAARADERGGSGGHRGDPASSAGAR